MYAPYLLHKKMWVLYISKKYYFSLHKRAVKIPLFSGSYNLFPNFSLTLSSCFSIPVLLVHCSEVQLYQQNVWQMVYICISLLEKESAPTNISFSFSLQHLQQIRQNSIFWGGVGKAPVRLSLPSFSEEEK